MGDKSTQIEIIYRIYQVKSDEEIAKSNVDSYQFLLSKSQINSFEVAEDCMICDCRDDFKKSIKSLYGEQIKFAYSMKYPPGTIYCIIIGEHCYTPERYFNKIKYICSNCGCEVTGYVDSPHIIQDYEIRSELCNQNEKYQNAKFCSRKCKDNFIRSERKKCLDDGLIDESFITKSSFSSEGISGYIYKISKKSTGEFYIGQTIYAPIFRWGQHLKTDRFDISGILDYVFEVIEIVKESDNIPEREKYWIQKYYKECPEKSLNISCTANLIDNRQLCLDEF